MITVQERQPSVELQKNSGVSSIVARYDGVITEITVSRGRAVCKVGQAVKAGSLLVSGFTDCDICIRAERAEGEIYAQTKREMVFHYPCQWAQKTEKSHTERKYALVIGKKRINFYKSSGISEATCDKMYEQSYITLPGGFQLPVCVITEVCTYYDTQPSSADEAEAYQCLETFANQYLLSQMTAGRIVKCQTSVLQSEESFCMDAVFSCVEMIGKTRFEENLDLNGNDE